MKYIDEFRDGILHARYPIGSCMVSSEGACAAYYGYGQYREAQ